jgi:hypothetical protein
MIYLLAIFIPWLALLLYGRVFQAIVNFLMWAFAIVILVVSLGIAHALSAMLWLLCVVHAILAINAAKQDRRNRALIDAIERSRR